MPNPINLRFLPVAVLGLLLAAPGHARTDSRIVPALAPSPPTDAPGAEKACGQIGTGTAPTPEGLDIYPAAIMQIDGERPRLARAAYRLQPGKHVLVIAEGIPPYRLGTAQQAQIAKMQRRRDFSGYFKPLVVEVKPDTLQRVGVRLLRDRLDTAGIRGNAYWEPVVWEELPHECN